MTDVDTIWIDTHAHLYLGEFDADRSKMMERCSEAGVMKIFMPNIDSTTIDKLLEVEADYPEHCFAMMGLHPCSVKDNFQPELQRVEDWLSRRKFSAVGEIGTDLYWDKSFWEQQKEAFSIQVEWAKQYNLPVVIHCRESLEETITMVEKLQDGTLKGIFHCFTGTVAQASRITELGFCLGIGGVATFKNGGLDRVLPDVDPAYIVLETDSPYLAPVPFRGKRNEPSYIPNIGARVAEVYGQPIETIRSLTSAAAGKIFGIA